MSSTESHPDTRAPDWAEVQASPEFQQLRHRLRRFVFPVTGLLSFLLGYLGTVWSKEKADCAKFAEMEVRSLTGVGVEPAAVH
jgi:hypothetical protein